MPATTSTSWPPSPATTDESRRCTAAGTGCERHATGSKSNSHYFPHGCLGAESVSAQHPHATARGLRRVSDLADIGVAPTVTK
jgi:hypothetical protein